VSLVWCFVCKVFVVRRQFAWGVHWLRLALEEGDWKAHCR
jgi:hypothetical protein